MKRFIFLGAPGVGKGTFAKILSKQYNLRHISLGDLLRNEVERGTTTGKGVQEYMKAGKLVPDEVVNKMVVDSLAQVKEPGFILDGYPRTASQARYLHDHYTVPRKSPVTAVNITLDRQVTLQKLLGRRQCRTCGGAYNTAHIVERGYDMPAILPNQEYCSRGGASCPCVLDKRDDDTADVITVRLNTYDRSIQDILDFYRNKSSLKSFDVKKGIKDTNELWKVMVGEDMPVNMIPTSPRPSPAYISRLRV
eukprot:gene7823-8459_t